MDLVSHYWSSRANLNLVNIPRAPNGLEFPQTQLNFLFINADSIRVHPEKLGISCIYLLLTTLSNLKMQG